MYVTTKSGVVAIKFELNNTEANDLEFYIRNRYDKTIDTQYSDMHERGRKILDEIAEKIREVDWTN